MLALRRNNQGVKCDEPFFFVFKCAGQSPVDFLFDFVEASQGPMGGFDVLDTRPRAGEGNCSDVSLIIPLM